MPLHTDTTVFVALGGNLGEVLRTFRRALSRLSELGFFPQALSSAYRTQALTVPGETRLIPDYWNAVCQVITSRSAVECLDVLLRVESEAGRVRAERWGPRTLDLDLLLFGDQQIEQEGLVVPHARMRDRLFVMAPLAEIAPDVLVAPDGKSVREIYTSLSYRSDEIREVRGFELESSDSSANKLCHSEYQKQPADW